jgi:hypothetical protein
MNMHSPPTDGPDDDGRLTVEQEQHGDLQNEEQIYRRMRRRRAPMKLAIAAAVAVAGVLAGLLFWSGDRRLGDLWPGGDASESTEATAVEPASDSDAANGVDPGDAAPATEPLAADVAATVASSELVQRWLSSRDWLRRLTAAVNAVADGHSPRAPLSELRPEGAFQVRRRGRVSKLYMAQGSMARYDALTRAFVSVRPARAARLYESVRPELERAQAELGIRDRTFRATVEQAVTHLLETPTPSGPIELTSAKGAAYRFKNPQLEKLSAAQKHLLRMGPRNARAVKRHLRALLTALNRL